MNDTIHRDVFKEVMAEYKRIDAKNPLASVDVKMKFAKDFVRAKAFADTIEILTSVYGKR